MSDVTVSAQDTLKSVKDMESAYNDVQDKTEQMQNSIRKFIEKVTAA
jgi:GH25 family lysozyme M1 (1,4-beta-N-acetylmuramidase)